MLNTVIKFFIIFSSWKIRSILYFLFSGKAAPIDCYFSGRGEWKLLVPGFGYGVAIDALVFKISKIAECKILSRDVSLDSYEYKVIVNNIQYIFYADNWGICSVFCNDNNRILELRDILIETKAFFIRNNTPPHSFT